MNSVWGFPQSHSLIPDFHLSNLHDCCFFGSLKPFSENNLNEEQLHKRCTKRHTSLQNENQKPKSRVLEAKTHTQTTTMSTPKSWKTRDRLDATQTDRSVLSSTNSLSPFILIFHSFWFSIISRSLNSSYIFPLQPSRSSSVFPSSLSLSNSSFFSSLPIHWYSFLQMYKTS